MILKDFRVIVWTVFGVMVVLSISFYITKNISGNKKPPVESAALADLQEGDFVVYNGFLCPVRTLETSCENPYFIIKQNDEIKTLKFKDSTEDYRFKMIDSIISRKKDPKAWEKVVLKYLKYQQ